MLQAQSAQDFERVLEQSFPHLPPSLRRPIAESCVVRRPQAAACGRSARKPFSQSVSPASALASPSLKQAHRRVLHSALPEGCCAALLLAPLPCVAACAVQCIGMRMGSAAAAQLQLTELAASLAQALVSLLWQVLFGTSRYAQGSPRADLGACGRVSTMVGHCLAIIGDAAHAVTPVLGQVRPTPKP